MIEDFADKFGLEFIAVSSSVLLVKIWPPALTRFYAFDDIISQK